MHMLTFLFQIFTCIFKPSFIPFEREIILR